MELLDGMDLQQLDSADGAVPSRPTGRSTFLLQMCDSLEDAHDCGLVHRDIKPANIYACRGGTSTIS